MALKPRARFECYPGNLVPQWHVTGGYADIWHDDLCLALVRWYRIQSMALHLQSAMVGQPMPEPTRAHRFMAWCRSLPGAAVIGALAGLMAGLLCHASLLWR